MRSGASRTGVRRRSCTRPIRARPLFRCRAPRWTAARPLRRRSPRRSVRRMPPSPMIGRRAVPRPVPHRGHQRRRLRQRPTDRAIVGCALSDRGLPRRPQRRRASSAASTTTPTASTRSSRFGVADLRSHVVEQGLGQEFLGQCGAVLFLTMILQRMRPKYQDRSYRYGLLEAGHIGENAYLAATSRGWAPAASARSWTTRSTRCSASTASRRPSSTCWP